MERTMSYLCLCLTKPSWHIIDIILICPTKLSGFTIQLAQQYTVLGYKELKEFWLGWKLHFREYFLVHDLAFNLFYIRRQKII